MSEDRPRVGVSACLLGQRVRWDGGHKRDDFVADTLASVCEWLPVCPEVEAGMGVPRPPVRLVARGSEVRMIDPESQEDHTAAMTAYARRRVTALLVEDLDGFVLKKDSPSCGAEGVAVYRERGDAARRDGRGLFAAELFARLPMLPVVEEQDLQDPALREEFVQRLLAHRRRRLQRP